jgi:hypothetical protein
MGHMPSALKKVGGGQNYASPFFGKENLEKDVF